MVRFSWHVEDGLNAYLPPGAYSQHKESSVRHAACEIEVQNGKDTLEAIFTLPANYLDAAQMKETGIILGHGSNASEWKGKLLTDIAVYLAMQGYVVLRYCCRHKEGRRQKMFEKSLDACATSPFARGVTKWVLAGVGSGARVAAAVGMQCRGLIAGFVFISYPLKEFLPPPTKAKRGEDEDDSAHLKSSEEPLRKLEQPILFLMGDTDKYCSPAEMRAMVATMASQHIRLDLFEDANQDFKNAQGKGPAGSVVRRLCSNFVEFVAALEEGNLKKCQVPKASEILGIRVQDRDQRQAVEPSTSATTDANGLSVPPSPGLQLPKVANNASIQTSGPSRSSIAPPERPQSGTRPSSMAAVRNSLPFSASEAQRPSSLQAQAQSTSLGSQVPSIQPLGTEARATAAGMAPQLQPSIPQSLPSSTAASVPQGSGASQSQAGQGFLNMGLGQPGGLQLPQLYQQLSQQVLGGQMLSSSQQAQQLLKALAAQQMNAQQQQNYQQPGAPWGQHYSQPPPQHQHQHYRQQANPASSQPNIPTSLQQMMAQHLNAQSRGPSQPSQATSSAVGVEAAKSQSQAHAGAQMLHISNAASTFPPTIRQPEGAAKVQRNESD